MTDQKPADQKPADQKPTDEPQEASGPAPEPAQPVDPALAAVPRVEVVFVEEPTDDMAELVDLEELIPDDPDSGDEDSDDATQPRGADFAASVLLGVLLIVVSAVFVIVGLVGFSAQAISCEGAGCNDTVVSLGTQLLAFGVPLLALATIVVTIVRLVRHKLAFPVVLIGLAACLLVFLIASFLVSEAVPG